MADWKNIKYAMCTLFDSNYLDKGLVLYDSLEKHASNFTLYILAMNDKCYEVLTDMKLKHVVPIKLEEFENEDLLRVKPNRGIGEYCWTCGSSLLKYVIETYRPDYCSYIDADMAFYDDPLVLIDEMEERNASVSIVGHRFNWFFKKQKEKIVGKYCVECNTFKNDKKAVMLLNTWVMQCLDHCSLDGDGIYWGDQKYMDKWVDDYNFVIETQNLGAGVAPWNVAQYKLINFCDNGKIEVECKSKAYNLLFYHFENVCFIEQNRIYTGVYTTWAIDDNLGMNLYKSYLTKVLNIKDYLKEKHQIDVLIKKHPGIQTDQEKSVLARILQVVCSFEKIRNVFLVNIPSIIYNHKNYVSVTKKKVY